MVDDVPDESALSQMAEGEGLPPAFRRKTFEDFPNSADLEQAADMADGYNEALEDTNAADLWRENQEMKNAVHTIHDMDKKWNNMREATLAWAKLDDAEDKIAYLRTCLREVLNLKLTDGEENFNRVISMAREAARGGD